MDIIKFLNIFFKLFLEVFPLYISIIMFLLYLYSKNDYVFYLLVQS